MSVVDWRNAVCLSHRSAFKETNEGSAVNQTTDVQNRCWVIDAQGVHLKSLLKRFHNKEGKWDGVLEIVFPHSRGTGA